MARPKKTNEVTIPESVYSLEPTGKTKGKLIYRDNPFITTNNFVVTVRNDLQLVGGNLEIRDKENNDVSTGVIGAIRQVDNENFIKLYTKNVGIFFDISSTAQKALIAVLYRVQETAKDKAEIFLSYPMALECYTALNFAKIPSKSTFALGIRQLIKMGFLAAHYAGESWYWFNPNLVFNGDRVRFVQEYRVVRQKQKELEQGTLPI